MKYNKNHCCKPNINIRETVKVADIHDAFGNLRYKVSLTSYDIPVDGLLKQAYEIQVVNCFSGPNPLIILQKPADDEIDITNYNFALAFYNQCIKQYSCLVKAETRDFQDISVATSKLNYRIVYPECCQTCRWAKTRKTKGDFIEGITGRLECHNPINMQSFRQDNFDCNCLEKHFHKVDSSKKLITIYPNVKPFGLCDGYSKCSTEIKSVPGDSLIDLVDKRVEQITGDIIDKQLTDKVGPVVEEHVDKVFDKKIDTALDTALDEAIDSDIIPKVGEAIDKKLKENPPILVGDDKSFQDLVDDNNNDGSIDKDDLEINFIGGGA